MDNANYALPLEMLEKWATEIPNQVYLRQPVDGSYKEKTWANVYDETLKLANALQKQGLKKGDVVAILAKNCAEWFITDYAISAAGLISAPIYYTAGEKTIRYILDHSEAKAIVVGKLDDLEPANAAIADGITKIAMPYQTISCDLHYDDLIASYDPIEQLHAPSLDDTISIIYTSGSTGNPKGVVMSYKNISYSSTTAVSDLNFTPQDRLLSYLPLAHITERAMIEYVSLQHGCTVTFNESLDTFVDDLKSANPSMFISVPRLWVKFQAGILAKIPPKKLDRLLSLPIVNRIIRRKLKAQLGLHNARLCGSGAAPISPGLLAWYEKIGIPISEGLGMSETSGIVTSQFPFRADKLGTVGKAVAGVELKLTAQGELLIKGDGVVKGYHKDVEKTAETFVDGWLHTGDKAEIDAEGYVRITGRVKEIFKTGKGKYVAPVPIESVLQENIYIEQVCVMGAGLPQPVALAVLASETTNGVDSSSIIKSIEETLQETNRKLEAHEKISHTILAKEAWTIENGLMTPTLKIKRGKLEEKYLNLIAELPSSMVSFEQPM